MAQAQASCNRAQRAMTWRDHDRRYARDGHGHRHHRVVMMIFAALIMLAEANVFLDMAENVRRIAARATRRAAEEEM